MVAMELAKHPGLEHVHGFDSGYAMRLDQIRKRTLEDSGCSLLEALQELRLFDLTDPRDKVYAALGLVSELPAGGIVPDYSKSCREVYTDVVRCCLEHAAPERRLECLGMVTRPAPDSVRMGFLGEVMPTWAPDWKALWDVHEFPKTFSGDDIDSELNGKRVYHACGDRVADAKIQDDKLIVQGVYIDSIVHVSTISEEVLGTSTERSWTLENPDDAYPTGGNYNEALLHMLVADVQRIAQKAQRRGYAMDWSVEDNTTAILDGEENLQRRYMRASMRNATFLRRLVWTEKGYIGLAPAAAAVGDKVCVLFGGQVLYVLRPRGTNATTFSVLLRGLGWGAPQEIEYEFMGECYVHGLMDGKALEMGGREKGKGVEEEIFTLV